jgi:hypothetical protein
MLTYEQIASIVNNQYKTKYTPQKVCDLFSNRRSISKQVEVHLSYALSLNIDYLRFINGRLPNFDYSRYPDEKAVMSLLANWQTVYGAGVFDEDTD